MANYQPHSASTLPLPKQDMELDISELLRQFSPSPNPIQPPSPNGLAHHSPSSSSPEPPDISDIQFIRQRLIAMGLVDPPTSTNSSELISQAVDLSQRERELAEMVSRANHHRQLP